LWHRERKTVKAVFICLYVKGLRVQNFGQLGRCGSYPQGGQLAITLVDADTSEPIANLSTNLAVDNRSTAPDAAGVKVWSENAPIIETLLASE
jgi:hypothetical protein